MDKTIKVESLSFAYSQEEKILDNISLEIKEKDIVGLIGKNGSGKTTLLECLYGSLIFDGKISSSFEKKLFLPTDLELFGNLTSKEMIDLLLKLHKKNFKDTENEIDLLVNSLGLENKMSILINQLSFGMKNKIKIMLALLLKPDLLLLDEPMVGLDLQSQIHLKKILKEIAQKNNIGIVISSHDMNLIEDICTEVIELNAGKLRYSPV
ncbi:ABC transporter, ATP-binding protein [Carnobacterium sp. 17-4]|uniref:ATP-binding cassette domain-containing protein n=1 Tax=Carnobacterium sp. (strain 17-4) TaxID=208596 RepID=UPI00020588D3|nr:ABC transporter ATP-binding protein [Carnobacterium sp. 17-4]AEB28836.1 ABC transporter, ATP-binding protein [Carnobacterium sp. 17-4]